MGVLRLPHAPCGVLRFAGVGAGQPPLQVQKVDTLLDQTAALLVHDAIMVNGVVEDTEGNPVPIETVGASWRSSEFERSVGEVRGHRFEVAVPPDTEISFSMQTEGPVRHSEKHTSPSLEADPWELVLTVSPRRTIQVLCPEDAPGCGADSMPMCMWNMDTDMSMELCQRSGDEGFSCVCGEGPVVITGMKDYEGIDVPAEATEVTLTPMASALNELEGVEVEGTAVLVPGLGPCSVEFGVIGAGRELSGTGTCGPDGAISVVLPVGKPVFVGVRQGDRLGAITAEVEADGAPLEPVVLAGDGSLSLTLVDSSGAFISEAFALLRAMDDEGGIMHSGNVSSAAGWHLTHLPAGTYDLEVRAMGSAKDQDFEAVEVTIGAGEAVELELQAE